MDKLSKLQTFIGKEFTESPSPFMRWLNPIVISAEEGQIVFQYITTINNAIDYFSTAKENDNIIAETKVIKRGRQFVNAQCEIWNADKSRLIARGTSNLFKINN